MTGYVRTDKQLLVAAMGFSTSAVTGIALGLIEYYTGYAIYSWTLWFVVPIGAILAGSAAASGYYTGAMLFHQKPVGGVLFNMAAASVSAYFLVHCVPYYLVEVEGLRVKDAVSFWQYMDYNIRHTSIKLLRGGASTGELGRFWGYAYASLQLVGFSLGGISVFVWLASNPYCEKCARYLAKTGKQERYTSDSDAFVSSIKEFANLVEQKRFDEAILFHANKMGTPLTTGHHLRTSVITRACTVCGINHLDFIASKLHKNDWKDIDETHISLFTNKELAVAE